MASYIYVKALDRAGNERVVEVSPIKPRYSFWPSLAEALFYVIIIVIVVALGFAIKKFQFKVRINKKNHVQGGNKKPD